MSHGDDAFAALPQEIVERIVAHVLDGLFPLSSVTPATHPDANPCVGYKGDWDAENDEFRGCFCLTLSDVVSCCIFDSPPRSGLYQFAQGKYAHGNNCRVHLRQQCAIRHLVRLASVSHGVRAQLTSYWRPVYRRFVTLYTDAFDGTDTWACPTYTTPVDDPEWYRLAVIGLCAQLPERARAKIPLAEANDFEHDNHNVYLRKGECTIHQGLPRRQGKRMKRKGMLRDYYVFVATRTQVELPRESLLWQTVATYEALMKDEHILRARMQAVLDKEEADVSDDSGRNSVFVY